MTTAAGGHDTDTSPRGIRVREDEAVFTVMDALDLSVMEVTRTALTIKSDVTFEEWQQIGRALSVIRKAWDTAVLKAHGHQPVWCKSNTLAPESRAVLHAIDLHFHDLRHEAGSRTLEEGMPVHEVKEMLGHADLSQTTTYLNAMQDQLQESIRKRDERRKICKQVAKNGAIELAPLCNGEPANTSQVLVN